MKGIIIIIIIINIIIIKGFYKHARKIKV